MCIQRRRKIVGIAQVVSSTWSPSFSPPSSQRTVFPPARQRFPCNSFDIAFSEILEASPLKSVPASRSSSAYLSRAFLLLSKLVLECAPRPSFAEKPAADKKRKAEVRGGESPDERNRRARREEMGGDAGESQEGGRFSLLFARIQFPAVFALIANAAGKRRR